MAPRAIGDPARKRAAEAEKNRRHRNGPDASVFNTGQLGMFYFRLVTAGGAAGEWSNVNGPGSFARALCGPEHDVSSAFRESPERRLGHLARERKTDSSLKMI